MRKFRPLQEPIRLQDLLNFASSRAEKKIAHNAQSAITRFEIKPRPLHSESSAQVITLLRLPCNYCYKINVKDFNLFQLIRHRKWTDPANVFASLLPSNPDHAMIDLGGDRCAICHTQLLTWEYVNRTIVTSQMNHQMI